MFNLLVGFVSHRERWIPNTITYFWLGIVLFMNDTSSINKVMG